MIKNIFFFLIGVFCVAIALNMAYKEAESKDKHTSIVFDSTSMSKYQYTINLKPNQRFINVVAMNHYPPLVLTRIDSTSIPRTYILTDIYNMSWNDDAYQTSTKNINITIVEH